MRIRSGVTVASRLVTNQPIIVEAADALTNRHRQLILDVGDIFVRTIVAFRIRTLLQGSFVLLERRRNNVFCLTRSALEREPFAVAILL